METQEHVVFLEGPDPFLDIVYETIEGYVRRTGEEYQQVITGVDTAEVGDVDRETESVLPLYVLGSIDADEALEQVNLALDRIAGEHNMDLARQNVQVTFEEGRREEE